MLGEISEATLLQCVTDLARLLQWRVYHPWRSDHSEAGWPDLALVRVRQGEPPRLLFAELKRQGKEPSRAQRAWLLDLAAVSLTATMLGRPQLVRVAIWRPEDWLSGEIERVLRGSGHGGPGAGGGGDDGSGGRGG